MCDTFICECVVRVGGWGETTEYATTQTLGAEDDRPGLGGVSTVRRALEAEDEKLGGGKKRNRVRSFGRNADLGVWD